MNSRDTLRFITGFLILSLFAGTSAFLLAGIRNAPGTQPPQKTIDAQGAGDVNTLSVRSERPNPAPFNTDGNTEDGGQYTANMTDVLANSMAKSLVENNPDGPQDAGDGQGPSLAAPVNINDVVANAVVEQSGNISADSWKIEYDLLAKRIPTQKTSADNVAQYAAELQKIAADGYNNPNITQLASQGDASSFSILKTSAEETISRLVDQKTPDALTDYHKKLLAVAILQKEAISAAADSYSDPLKSEIALQKIEPQIDQSLAELEQEAGRANEKIIGALGDDNAILALLGVHTAHALIPTVDWSHIGVTIASWAKQFWNDIKTKLEAMVLSMLQDQLVHRLVQQVITWVQGGGKPQFVQNWQGFLEGVGKDAAGLAIDQLAPGLCSPFSALIKVQLQQAYLNDAPKPRCTLDSVVNNFENFYNNFENGGWIAFGTAAVPSNNFFGASVEAQAYVAGKMAAKQDAKNNETVANKGFLGTEGACTKTTKNTYLYSNFDVANSDMNLRKQDANYVSYSCAKNAAGKVECTVETCQEGGKQVTTPGGTISDQLGRALASPIDRIVNAKDITALISALINSGLMKLIRAGQRGVTGLINGGANESTPATNSNDPCAGATTPEEIASCSAVAHTVASSTDPAAAQAIANQAKASASETISQLQGGKTADASWLGMASSTRGSLSQVATVCTISSIPNLSNDALVAANAVSAMQPVVSLEATLIDNALVEFQNLQSRMNSAALSEMTGLANELSTLRDKYNAILMASPDGRYANLQDVAKAADDNLQGTPASCATAIPSVTTQ